MKANVTGSIFKQVKNLITKNSTTILTVVAVSGVISTIVLAVKATPKAVELIQADSRIEHDGDPYAYTKKEAFCSAWKVYIPSACMGLVTIACIIGINSVGKKQKAALVTAYGITEAAFKDYKSKVVELFGKNKELKVRDEVAKEMVVKNNPGNTEVIFTSKGNVLCLDGFSGRLFRSDIESIRKSVNDLNSRIITETFISLNDFYYELGLAELSVGNHMGWYLLDGLIDIQYSSQLTEGGDPCLVIYYDVVPK